MTARWDVLIIGAGSAGLNALREARKQTENVRLIHHGPFGTTCARVGCMPSKVLVQTAKDFHRREAFAARGIDGAEHLRVDLPRVMKHIRAMRDRFVGGVIRGMEQLRPFIIEERARFVDADVLEVGQQRLQARRIVIATGSRPEVPTAWRELGDRILTSNQIFELPDLPPRIAVIGLGAIGLELGQALTSLGLEVVGFEALNRIGGLIDPEVNSAAIEALRPSLKMTLGYEAELTEEGDCVRVTAGGEQMAADKVLVCLGRRPNIDDIGIEATGAPLDERGFPRFDPATMQIEGTPIFIAGDANADRLLLHEASDEGRIAGHNAARAEPERFLRRTALSITFCEPSLAHVGTGFDALPADHVIGSVAFSGQGRALAMGRAAGLLRVYGQRRDGRLLGAELAAPDGEHLAHELSWLIQQRMTVFEALQLPFYHPVLEEGVRAALRELAAQVTEQPAMQELRRGA